MALTRKWIGIGALVAVVVLAGAVIFGIGGMLPAKPGTDTVDRSQPAVLQALHDLSEYHAASGDYQVVIDIEKDVRYVPSALAGQRTLFVAAGTIDAFVDFKDLPTEALVVDQQAKTVRLNLPDPKLGKPNLNNERSYVYSQDRGLFDKLNALVGAPEDQREFYVAAEKRIAEAADKSSLRDRARDNTRSMLTGMLSALGYKVTMTPQA